MCKYVYFQNNIFQCCISIVSYDTCYILVKDQIAPVVTTVKKTNLGLAAKKVWVDAENFDETSWDNCGINLLMARRTDWESACIALCDSLEICFVSMDGDTLWQPILGESTLDEVANYYALQLLWLKEDDTNCGSMIYNAWQYDLMRYATLHCANNQNLTDDTFHELLSTAIQHDVNVFEKFLRIEHDVTECTIRKQPEPQELLEQLPIFRQIGGGWGNAVVFDCMDACGAVGVELLAVDYWCNWSIGWTDVWVEDKSPASIGQEITEEIEISCASYKASDLDVVVLAASAGDEASLKVLDSLFGGYQKAWVDPYGVFVDKNGDPIEKSIEYIDMAQCTCTTTVEQVEVYDEHIGTYFKDSIIVDCYYLPETLTFSQGIIAANCASEIFCDQTVWSDFDHCGEGYVYRKWSIVQGCPPDPEHPSTFIPDTLERIQRIWVSNSCQLSKYMFELPSDTIVDACMIEYADDGSGYIIGAADVENTGVPTYRFDDDCRLLGIGRKDKVFKIVGGDAACFKIHRTWYFADWCGGKPTSETWWADKDLVLDSFVQKILIRDTIAPVCTITGPVPNNGVIEAAGCSYDLEIFISVDDACGVASYTYQLLDISEDVMPQTVSSGVIEQNGTELELSFEGLVQGRYEVRIRVTDNCQNESFCSYIVNVFTGQKPSAVCLSSMTLDLIGWDSNGDGFQDSARAIIWAKEFNSSSQPACGGDAADLTFYIELLDGFGDETFFDDTSYLILDCDDIGTQMVRMWVIDPSGTADFCDVLLEVQDNTNACEDVSVNTISGPYTLEAEQITSNSVKDNLTMIPDDGTTRENVLIQDNLNTSNALQIGHRSPPRTDLVSGQNIPSNSDHERALMSDCVLYQNKPNPFRSQTMIGFYLPRSMSARLIMFDVTGRLLKTIEGHYAEGYHEVEVRYEDLNVEGLIYYKLETSESTAVRHMIVVK